MDTFTIGMIIYAIGFFVCVFYAGLKNKPEFIGAGLIWPVLLTLCLVLLPFFLVFLLGAKIGEKLNIKRDSHYDGEDWM